MGERSKPIAYKDDNGKVKEFLETLGTVVATRERRFLHLPFWLEDVDGELRILEHEQVPEYVKEFMKQTE